MGREIKKVIVHCSDSDLPQHDNVETIHSWHRDRGWKGIGYHFVITKNPIQSNSLQVGRDIQEVGAHCKEHNADSIGICLTGKSEFTSQQFEQLVGFLAYLNRKYGTLEVYPHSYFNKEKTCPNFHNLAYHSKAYDILQVRHLRIPMLYTVKANTIKI